MKVLVIEDHPIVVSGCRQLFANHLNFAFFAARSIAEARQVLKEMTPDVVVVDVNLPDGSGLEFVRELRRRSARLGIVVFSVADDPILAAQALDYGAKAFVSKNGRPADLLAAADAAARGEIWLSDDLLQQVAVVRADPASRQPALTLREKKVLRLLVGGWHHSEIAKELNISSKLVATDCSVIRQKFSARTTAEMVALAMKSNLGAEISPENGPGVANRR
ncbi:response regulator transcription factor [Hyphomicrobium sp.]|jgi:DNA-binding NarL/FixJ family response regulator|uniref:response regulator transcription factor n=1 Tax=Hyphomicrobium sp. TaxID=82 RepID=UPI002BCC5E28|nr:response regulator transcription factor [Hyphomicrobium sp.]HVZ05016.1 response regulator transcription factor [Hyphomicrobium sp.]